MKNCSDLTLLRAEQGLSFFNNQNRVTYLIVFQIKKFYLFLISHAFWFIRSKIKVTCQWMLGIFMIYILQSILIFSTLVESINPVKYFMSSFIQLFTDVLEQNKYFLSYILKYQNAKAKRWKLASKDWCLTYFMSCSVTNITSLWKRKMMETCIKVYELRSHQLYSRNAYLCMFMKNYSFLISKNFPTRTTFKYILLF